MIDRVAEKQALLKKANSSGSLSNEQAFRNSIEAFQTGFGVHEEPVVEVSSDADKLFELDMAAIRDLINSTNPEIRVFAAAALRSFNYLQRNKK